MTTQTIVVPRPAAPIPQPALSLQRGVGHVLGGAEREPHPPRPISDMREGFVRGRLEMLRIRGREAKITALFEQLRGVEGADEWRADFDTIDPEETDNRAVSLAVLVVRVLRPQNLFDQEISIRDILQSLLTRGESVEMFLEDCEVALREEKLFNERCARESSVARIYLAALRSGAARVNSRIEAAFASVEGRLRALQAARESRNEEITEEMKVLVEKVNQFQSHFAGQAAAIAALDTDDQQLEATLMECEALMKRLV